MLYSDDVRTESKKYQNSLLFKWLSDDYLPYSALIQEIEKNYREIVSINPTVQGLSSRLISRSDEELHTAMVELYFWHMLEVKLGNKVENHPILPHATTHPEFLVDTAGESIYLEVRTLFDDNGQTQGWQTLNNLKIRIKNELRDSPIHMIIEPDGLLTGNFPLAKATRAIVGAANRFLESDKRKATNNLNIEDIDIRLSLFREAEGPLVDLGHQGIFSVTPDRSIDAIRKKVKKYGKLGKPFVLVLDLPDTIRFGDTTVMAALFGHTKVTYYPDKNLLTDRGGERDGSGIFKPNANRGLSAVIHHAQKYEDGVRLTHELSVYHNPHALMPLSTKTFPNIRQFVPVKHADRIVLNWQQPIENQTQPNSPTDKPK